VSCSEVKAEKDNAFECLEARLPDGHVHSFKVVSIFGNAVQRASNRRDRGPTTFALSASATATTTPQLLSRRSDIDDWTHCWGWNNRRHEMSLDAAGTTCATPQSSQPW
jgi:hypothetical protein